MKTLKTLTAIIIICTLNVIAGCSDDIISPTVQSSVTEKNSFTKNESSDDIERYHSNISLKPHDSYTYTYENTGYYKFNSISILNCGNTKGSLDISGYSDDQAFVLGCNSKGFDAWSITIVNTTRESVNLDVFLSGSKIRISHPHLPVETSF